MKPVPVETVFMTVRDEDLSAWLEIGWESGGAYKVPGFQVLIWERPTRPVAPLSVVLKNASKAGSAWSKYFRDVHWREIPCFLYLIVEDGEGGLTKVGIGSDVGLRLKTHQRHRDRLLTIHETWRLPNREAATDLERLIIDEFAEHRRQGREWLGVPAATVSRFIEKIITDFGIRGVERIAPDLAFVEPPELRRARLA